MKGALTGATATTLALAQTLENWVDLDLTTGNIGFDVTDGDAIDFSAGKSTYTAIQVGSDATAGQYSVLQFNDTVDLTGKAIVNHGVIKGDDNVDIDFANASYSGAGAIDNITAADTSISVAGTNIDINKILAATEKGGFDGVDKYDIGMVNITGTSLGSNILLEKTTDGTVTVNELAGVVNHSIDIGYAELYVKGDDDITFNKAVKVGTIEAVSTSSSKKITFNEAITFNDGDFGYLLIQGIGNETTVVVKKGMTGITDLDVAAGGILQNESDTLDLSAAEVYNFATGKIINGANKRLILSNYVGSVASSIDNTAEGAVTELKGDTATTIQIGSALSSLARADSGNIGNVEVSGNIVDKGIASSNNAINDGVITITGRITQSAGATNPAITAGGADLVFSGANNNVVGAISGNDITFTNNGGVYAGTVVASANAAGERGDITILSAGNTFNEIVQAISGDVYIAEANTFNAVVRTGTSLLGARGGNITIVNGGTFNGLIAVDDDADPENTGNILIQNGGTFRSSVVADNDIVIENGGSFTAVSAGDTLTAKGGTYSRIVEASNAISITDGSYARTITSYAGDITFRGSTVVNGAVIANDGNIILSRAGTFTGGFSTTGAATTRIKGGTTQTVGGDLDTNFIVESGGTAHIAGADATVKQTFSAEDGSGIRFGVVDGSANTPAKIGYDTATATSLNLSRGTTLNVDNSLLNVQGVTLFTKNATDNMTLDGDAGTTIQDIAAYLTTQTRKTVGVTTGFRIAADGSIVYDNTVVTDPDELETQLQDVLTGQGIGDKRPMIGPGTWTNMYNFNVTVSDNAIRAMSGAQRNMAILYNAAGGGRNFYNLDGNRRAAIAMQQFLNGTDLAGSLEAVTDTVRNFNRAVSNRAYNAGHLMNQVEYDDCGNIVTDCGGNKNRVWAGYTGMWGDMDGRDWDNGYEYDAHGLNVGYDHATSSGVGFGAAFGYSKGDYENKGALWDGSKIHNYSWGLFASYNHASGFFTTLSGSYTYSDYKMNNGFIDRSAFTAEGAGLYNGPYSDYAEYHGDTWSVGGKTGYDIQPVANLTITPTLGLYYYNTHTNRFGTTGGRSGMKYERNILEMPVELTVKYDIAVGCESTLSLVATGGYAYNFHNQGTKIHNFQTAASDSNGIDRYVKPGSSSWNAGGGVQYRYKNIDFGVNYEYYGRKSYDSHSLNANVGYSF